MRGLAMRRDTCVREIRTFHNFMDLEGAYQAELLEPMRDRSLERLASLPWSKTSRFSVRAAPR